MGDASSKKVAIRFLGIKISKNAQSPWPDRLTISQDVESFKRCNQD